MFSSRGISLITGAALIALIALICGLAINGLLQLQTLGEEKEADETLTGIAENHINAEATAE